MKMDDDKELLTIKIDQSKEKIINLTKEYNEIFKEIRNIQKNRTLNHIIIFLSFVISVLINIELLNVYPQIFLYDFIKFISAIIPYISLVSYELKNKDKKQYLNELNDKKYLLNEHLFSEEFMLNIYNQELKNYHNQENKIIFSKHKLLDNINEDYKNKSIKLIKKIK